MIPRTAHLTRIATLLDRFPVVALVGARQTGKTTLARMLAAERDEPTHFFDLEDPADEARLAEPGLVLRPLHGLVVVDEVQWMPRLFELLRVLADRPDSPARFLVLGSASPDLVRGASETLAGRIAYHRLPGFSLAEFGVDRWQDLWLRGGFPRSTLAPDDAVSAEWRRQFVDTFLTRDVPALGVGSIPATTARRFWTMLAHGHGQLLNASALGRSFGISDTTVRRYLDTLTGAFVVRQLLPWHANVRKRQVRSPKVFVEDTGLLHTLLGLETQEDLERHPVLGASWESFAMQQVVAHLGARHDECFFWATHSGAELDLLVVRGNRRLGFEFKRTETPRMTKSMHSALADLELERLDVVHAGQATFPMTEQVRAVAARSILDEVPPL